MRNPILLATALLALLAPAAVTAPGGTVFIDLGSGLPGVTGAPVLIGSGTLEPDSDNAIGLVAAATNAPVVLFTSLGPGSVPFKGGTLVAFPFALPPVLQATDAVGELFTLFTLPEGGTGLDIVVQYAVQDAAAVNGVALSNALLLDLQ